MKNEIIVTRIVIANEIVTGTVSVIAVTRNGNGTATRKGTRNGNGTESVNTAEREVRPIYDLHVYVSMYSKCTRMY